jgi:hypothetical protein
MAKGGIDVGAFGYATLGVHNPKAIVKATMPAPKAPAPATR